MVLCRNKDCDVIKAYSQQLQLRGKRSFFFQSVAKRTNDTALNIYKYETIPTRQISLFVTNTWMRIVKNTRITHNGGSRVLSRRKQTKKEMFGMAAQ